MIRACALFSLFIFSLPLTASGSGDLLIADFEGRDYGEWTVEGEAFGNGPARGTLPNQMEVSGYEGRRLVNSFNGGDDAIGTLTSPQFIIKRKFLSFLIGGGGYAGETCMNLLVDGEVARTATGVNTEPGGSEQLQWQAWDVGELDGREAVLQIVDNRTGGWGHINVDQIVQSDVRLTTERTRKFVAEKRYLNLPVDRNGRKTWVRLLRDDEILREFDTRLAPSEARTDFWVTLELSAFTGEKLSLWAENPGTSNGGFDLVRQADGLIGGEKLYREKYRPQFHFSAKRGWINDPNGLVYYDGEYHLFFQHNPYGWEWGNMTWGHAVSTDLVHWEEIGDAIHPDAHGTVFSGSAVVDWKNTTGFQTGDKPPLVCIFTRAGNNNLSSKGVAFTQGLAYSNDRGRTWTKYAGNPVQGHIAGDNRDPKVFWHAPTNQWVIVLYLDKNKMGFFTSPDLKVWTKTSTLESFYECPELFQLQVDADASRQPWVLYGAAGDYYLGEFDGREFKPATEALRFNYGDCFYASQTFNDLPAEDGRRIQIAWGRTGHQEMPFNQIMNFPSQLFLRETPDGPRLHARPVTEIESLYGKSHSISELALTNSPTNLDQAKGGLYDLLADIKLGDAEQIVITSCGLEVVYDVQGKELRCKDKTAPLLAADGIISLRLLVDRLSIEIFANDGAIYMPMANICEDEAHSVRISARGGQATANRIVVHELNSAWR